MTSAREARTSVVLAVLAIVAITVTVIVVPSLQFAYRSPVAHAAMETAATVIATIVASLAFVRARRTCAWTDLLLFGTLSLLAVTNLCFSLVPTLAGAGDGEFATWAPVAGRFLGGLGFVAAAFAGTRKIRAVDATARWTFLAAMGLVTFVAVGVAALAPVLPDGVEVRFPAEDSARPTLDGAPVVLALQLALVGLYAAAAVGFLRNAQRGMEGAPGYLAVAMVVAAGSRVHYFLYPSLYSEYVYVGDFLRVTFYGVLLAGTIAEILSYERRMAGLTLFEERRRMARDLHEGLVQELSYISAQSRLLAGGHKIQRSADRALLESRLAIASLMRASEESLAEALGRAAVDASRGNAEVEVQAPPDVEAPPAMREALLRIVGEAVTNAVRHGDARRVQVQVERNGVLRVRVRDDGRGFDPSAPVREDAHGLVDMRERVEALGGTFSLSARPGHGATVEVVVP